MEKQEIKTQNEQQALQNAANSIGGVINIRIHEDRRIKHKYYLTIDGTCVGPNLNYENMNHFLLGYNIAAKANPMRERIKSWYCNKYPTDEIGFDIKESATFEQLDSNIGEVYEIIDVSDSLVRERCFERIAKITNTSYQEVYERWIKD